MAIKINGTVVVNNNRDLSNIANLTVAGSNSFTSAPTTGVIKKYSRGELVNTLDNPSQFGTSAGDNFGTSTAMSKKYAVVGAPNEDSATVINSGKVYIYNIATGALLYTLDNPSSTSINFGKYVAIDKKYCIISSSDNVYVYNVYTGALLRALNPGNTTAVPVAISSCYGVIGERTYSNNSGRAHLYNILTGSLVRTLNNPNTDGTGDNDNFGYAVCISNNYLCVSAPGEDKLSQNDSGKVYVYNVGDGELVWTLDNFNAYSTSDNDTFGSALAIDKNYLVVSAIGEDSFNKTNSGKVYLYNLLDGQLIWHIENPSNNNAFSSSLSVTSNCVIVGAPEEDDSYGLNSGKVYIYDISTGSLIYTLDNQSNYEVKLNDNFGYSISASDNYLIVGAYNQDDTNVDSGKVYIFALNDIVKLIGTEYLELNSVSVNANAFNISSQLTNTLSNPNPFGTSTDDNFGYTVSVSGSYAAVGAYQEDESDDTNSGKVYVYNSITGVILYTLNNPNAYGTSTNDNFGVDLVVDGNYLAVSAIGESDSSGTNSGKVYVYDVSTGTLLYTLNNPNPYGTSTDDKFGAHIDISGNYLITSSYDEDDASSTGTGKAYIYNISSGTLLYTLNNPNAYGTAADDNFGRSVAISGNYAIVAAPYEDDLDGTDSGKAYIYNVITGSLLHTLNNPNPYGTTAGDSFGWSTDISGNYAIVGAPDEDDADGTGSGRVYIYNVITGALLHTLKNPNPYGTSLDDNFGYAVSISGNYAIVGAYREDDASGVGSGKVYIYSVVEGTLMGVLDNPNAYSTSADDAFGHAVSMSGNYIIVGAYGEKDASATSSSGKAYIYNLNQPIALTTSRNTPVNSLYPNKLLQKATVNGKNDTYLNHLVEMFS